MFINAEKRAILAAAPLFAGVAPSALDALLTALSPREACFAKGDVILRAGQKSNHIGILLAGQISAVRYSPDGTAMPVPAMGAGSVFGDILGGSSVASPVNIAAHTDCTVLWLSYDALLCPKAPISTAHGQLLQNLLRGISDKYFDLVHRVDLLVLKSLRAKLSAYLLGEAATAQSNTFTIPFTRAKLAAFLNCERSALCRELGRMQREGLIETYQKSVKLLKPEELSHFN